MNKLKAVWEQRKQVIIFCLIAMLFSLGGGGAKEFRRFVLPFIIALSAYKYKDASILKAFIFFVWTAFVLSLGYTPIMMGEQYLKLIGLGVLYSLGYALLCTWQRYIKIALVFVVLMPIAVWLNKRYYLNWQYVELIFGGCYAVGYSIVAGKESHGK